MIKVAVSSYSFSQYLNDGCLNQCDCIAKAKEIGFDAIEFVELQPHDGSTVEEYAKKLGDEAKRLGMPVTNFSITADFLKGSDGDLEKEVERVKKQVDIAALLGASGVRHDVTTGFAPGTRKYRGFKDVLPQLAAACREITEYAAERGIKTMVENHGFFCQDSDRVEKLVNTVQRDNFGLLADMGNFLCADENPATAFGRIAPYAFYVHAKDFIIKNGMATDPGECFFRTRGGNYLRGTIVGHGGVPVKQCLAVLKDNGYDDYVSIEFEGMEDALEGLRIGLNNIRRYLSEID